MILIALPDVLSIEMVMKAGKGGNSCIVIGAGIAGLAVAIRLRVLGMNVQIFESGSSPGGKISEKRIGDFRFDAGPTLMTKPGFIKELFSLLGKNADDYIQFKKPEHASRYFFPDGTYIDTFSDKSKFFAELKKKSPESITEVAEVLNASRRIYELTHEVFLERSLHRFRNYVNWPTLRGLLHFRKVRAFESMHQYNSRKLNDKRLVRLFDRFAAYNGSDPFQAPATLNVISHLELNEGVFTVEGGMYRMVEALVQLAKEAGVEIFTGEKVKEILIENKTAIGIRTDRDSFLSDFVVCNADVHSAYEKLMPETKRPEFILRQQLSSSVILFFWCLKRKVDGVHLHTTIFGKDDKDEYDALFTRRIICDEPTIYIYNSSVINSTDAPEGKANWFVMVTAPSMEGQNWDKLISDTRQHILRKLKKVFGHDIESLIEKEEISDPAEIEFKTGAWKGAVYGNSSNGLLSAFLRHPNFSSKNRNLYFCGGSVHPGSGIPLCLLSAKIVSEMIKRRHWKFYN